MIKQSLRILQVHGWWKAEHPGGVITMMKTLTEALEERGHNVTVLISDWNSPQVTRDTEDGREFHKLRLPERPERYWPLRRYLAWRLRHRAALSRLQAFARAHEIDIVHLHLASPYHEYFRLLHAGGGPPYIVTLHRGDVLAFAGMSSVRQTLMLELMRGAGASVAVSNWLAQKAAAMNDGRPVRCIHNALNPRDFQLLEDTTLPASLAAKLPARYAILLANIHPYKAQDVAIAAWKKVRRQAADLHLLLTGTGAMEGDLRRQAEELGVDDRVHFLGHVLRPHALKIAQNAMCMIAPSRSEGLPYVGLEAGLVGRPIITSDIGPFLELVAPEKEALVVPVDDADALATAVLRLDGDVALRERLALAMQARIKTDFLAPVMAMRYEQVYREVMAADAKTRAGNDKP